MYGCHLLHFYHSQIDFRIVIWGKKKTYPLNLAWPNCLQSTFLLDQGSSFCWWWPMAAVWPSVSPALPGDHEAEGVCCAAGGSWVGGFLHSVIQLGIVYGLPFCGPTVIDHYMCDMYPLLKLVCTDTYVTGILVVPNGGLICTAVFLLLLVSYGAILHSLKSLSQEGTRKALQTCGSHITVVSASLFPAFSCMWDLLRCSRLTNYWVCFSQS